MMYSLYLIIFILSLVCGMQNAFTADCVLNENGECQHNEVVNVVITGKTRYIVKSLESLLRKRFDISFSAKLNYYCLNSTYFREQQVTQQTTDGRITVLSDKLLYRMDETIKYSGLSYLTMNDTISLFKSNNKLILVTGILDVSVYYPVNEAYHVNRSSDMYYDSAESNSMLNGLIAMVNATNVVFVSGEPVDQSEMLISAAAVNSTFNMLFLSTLTSHDWVLPRYYWSSFKLFVDVKYVPVFVTSFGELEITNSNNSTRLSRNDSSEESESLLKPVEEDLSVNVNYRLLKFTPEMLRSYPTRDNTVFNAEVHQETREDPITTRNILDMKTETVGYLYYRCDRVDREAFFDLLSEHLNGIESMNDRQSAVVPLGRCAGLKNQSLAGNSEASRDHYFSRKGDHYLADAVRRYSRFKFVVAFENSRVPGYITEKLTNAYLAHAVPIYWGAPDVGNYFNELSMINCNHFATLADCAMQVMHVHTHADLYYEMLTAPILAGETDDKRRRVWSDLFDL